MPLLLIFLKHYWNFNFLHFFPDEGKCRKLSQVSSCLREVDSVRIHSSVCVPAPSVASRSHCCRQSDGVQLERAYCYVFCFILTLCPCVTLSSPLYFSLCAFLSVFPLVTSTVLFPPQSPNLFLIPLLVSVYKVFVLPAFLVSSLCDVPLKVPCVSASVSCVVSVLFWLPFFFFLLICYFAFCPFLTSFCA